MAAKKQRGAKAPRREQARANLRLDAEAYRRLLVYSVMENRAAGEIVSQLIAEHLRGWSMPGKITARATQGLSAEYSGQESESEPLAA